MNILFFCLCLFSPGTTDAMEAFARGELYFITFGRPSAEVVRDEETGIRYSSMGCVVRDGDMEYMESWNGFMTGAWEALSDPGVFFTLRTDTESLEYSHGRCVYSDMWGSVPLEIYPEDLSHVFWLVRRNIREEAEVYGHLQAYSPSTGDTLSARVPADTDILGRLFQRGREAIRINTLN
jgi:hypothetical protein